MAACQYPGAPYLDPCSVGVTCSAQVIRIYRLLMTLLLILCGVNSYDDRCDSVVWDLGGQNLGVHDVSGICSEGQIEWRNPYGAIRVSLHLRPIRLQKHAVNIAFESCFTVSAKDTSVKIFLDNVKSPALEPLVALNSSHPQMPRELCFTSEGDPIVLYMESELNGHSAAFGNVHIEYDNFRLPVTLETRNMDDCRPCTDEELIDAACSSDFALTGSMQHVVHHEEIDESHLHVSVKQVFRQNHNLFKDRRKPNYRSRAQKYPKLNIHTENGIKEWPQNVKEDAPSISNLDSDPEISSQSDGVIFAPHKCGIRKGEGDFLFIGRIRLKRALLQCAPRLEDFNRLWQHAIKTERNMCFLR